MIQIKDKNLQLYLNIMFNKKIEDITEEELQNVVMVSYENNVDDPEEYRIDLTELDIFPKLEGISFFNVLLTKENIEYLKKRNIKKLRLHHCASFDNLEILDCLQTFESLESFHNSYNFLNNMSNLEYLAITKPYKEVPLSLSLLLNMNNLKRLTLEKCIVKDLEYIENCKKIELLNLLWTELPDNINEIVKQLPNLKQLYIDKKYKIEGLNSFVEVKNTLFEFNDL